MGREHHRLAQQQRHEYYHRLMATETQAPSSTCAATEDYRPLRCLVTSLYRDVLAEADFVATTPVAASGSFATLFRPEIIFMDEAPHARELTTLIPMAYFDPLAWIFTGDVKQTPLSIAATLRVTQNRRG
ncbi:hypothetical protein TARUN_3629 [Trichoderma arundinaceum]|uniref:DNA2/NAM7 helicase helicase domain-containing protein n=1 Tax=Trichoderma arundinaceum TaxID=490622 RepID=A0A395NR87_TRIAR|nr:hypothetical protein TARUN_3629 [Trichoderma arundinaceum]